MPPRICSLFSRSPLLPVSSTISQPHCARNGASTTASSFSPLKPHQEMLRVLASAGLAKATSPISADDIAILPTLGPRSHPLRSAAILRDFADEATSTSLKPH